MEKRKQGGIMVLWNVMIGGYMRHGEFEAAWKLFDEMPRKSIVSWNGILTGYAENGFFKEALEIFWEIQMANVHPNYVTLVWHFHFTHKSAHFSTSVNVSMSVTSSLSSAVLNWVSDLPQQLDVTCEAVKLHISSKISATETIGKPYGS
ncbi:hypothetical protein NE237_027546 [Protea cynaroides]|uniref:Pentatricopeptide repeat-containing protein n=1 Tax=Protea cynaroides TaxID=273540 RepID=A0A9Q0GNR5_9MAGN|nr:hypothetical protein NE237_027546 [Protea cynaroides]